MGTDAENLFQYGSRRIRIPNINRSSKREAQREATVFRTDGVCEIQMNHGKVALVNREDFDKVSICTWHTSRRGENWYAFSSGRNDEDNKNVIIRMHRLILDLPDDVHVDHINGDGCDNRRCNMRRCTQLQNNRNSRHRRDGCSRFKGVERASAKWAARISVNRRYFRLGVFINEADAARAYDVAAREHFGEFARLNFPQEAGRA